MVRWVSRALFVVVVVALAVAPDHTWLYAQDSSVAIRIDPAAQTVPVNGTFTVQIVADLGTQMDPYGLAGYEFSLAYDNSYLEVIGATDAGQLSGPNGRTVGSLGPNIDNAAGQAIFGAYSYLETNPQAAGPTGTAALANVTLRAKQVGDTTLRLENALVTDVQARAWPDPGTGRQVNTQPGVISIEAGGSADTPTATSTASPSFTPTSTHTLTVTPSHTPTVTPAPTDTPTQTPTPTPTNRITPTSTNTSPVTPTPTATQIRTMTPEATTTPTATASPTPTPTATQTSTTAPTSTATRTVTTTPTSTASATPTATQEASQPGSVDRIYMPLVALNWKYGPVPVPTVAPTDTPAGAEPQFTCSGWCESIEPGARRQVVTSDRPVEDWRAFVNGMYLGVLTRETATQAILEAPENLHVRIEALHAGTWLVACESDVECPLP